MNFWMIVLALWIAPALVVSFLLLRHVRKPSTSQAASEELSFPEASAD